MSPALKLMEQRPTPENDVEKSAALFATHINLLPIGLT